MAAKPFGAAFFASTHKVLELLSMTTSALCLWISSSWVRENNIYHAL